MTELEKYYPNEWFNPFLDYATKPAQEHIRHTSRTFDFEIDGAGPFSFELSDTLQTFDVRRDKTPMIILSNQNIVGTTTRDLLRFDPKAWKLLEGLYAYWNKSSLAVDEISLLKVQLRIPQGHIFESPFVGELNGEANVPFDGWRINGKHTTSSLFVIKNDTEYIQEIQSRITFPVV